MAVLDFGLLFWVLFDALEFSLLLWVFIWILDRHFLPIYGFYISWIAFRLGELEGPRLSVPFMHWFAELFCFWLPNASTAYALLLINLIISIYIDLFLSFHMFWFICMLWSSCAVSKGFLIAMVSSVCSGFFKVIFVFCDEFVQYMPARFCLICFFCWHVHHWFDDGLLFRCFLGIDTTCRFKIDRIWQMRQLLLRGLPVICWLVQIGQWI